MYGEAVRGAFRRPVEAGVSTAAICRGGPWAISISPARTLLGASFLAALSLFFIGCSRALGAVRASTVVRGVTLVGLFVALVAIVQKRQRQPAGLWLWWPRKIDSLVSFVVMEESRAIEHMTW